MDMADVSRHEVRALQFYYLYGVLNEARLSIITNEQMADSFVRDALPFVLQFYRKGNPADTETAISRLHDNICDIQRTYAWALNSIGRESGRWILAFPDYTPAGGLEEKKRAILEFQQQISQVDGQGDMVQSWENTRNSMIADLDTECVAELHTRLISFEKCWALLGLTRMYYADFGLPLCLAPEQLVFEMKAGLAHLARAAFQSAGGSDVDKMFSNLKKASAHFERVVIDIFKVIIYTVLHNQQEMFLRVRTPGHEVSDEVWGEALGLRHNEAMCIGDEYDGRYDIYSQTCKELLARYVVRNNGQAEIVTNC